jgi:hypothetical protein
MEQSPSSVQRVKKVPATYRLLRVLRIFGPQRGEITGKIIQRRGASELALFAKYSQDD